MDPGSSTGSSPEEGPPSDPDDGLGAAGLGAADPGAADPGAVALGTPADGTPIPEGTPAEEQGPRRWSVRPSPVTVRRVLFGMCAGALVALVVPAWLVFPYYRDDRALDRIVRIVALDWRDFGEARARSRLEYELDDAGIGLWVRDEDCTLASHGPERQVGCRWSVPVVVPAVEVVVPLSFESVVAIGADGDLH